MKNDRMTGNRDTDGLGSTCLPVGRVMRHAMVAVLFVALAMWSGAGCSGPEDRKPEELKLTDFTVYTDWPFDAAEARRRQEDTAAATGVAREMTLDLGDGITMDLVLIPAGEFMMGSPESDRGRNNDEPHHRVRISRPYYLGKTEVTQAQWQAVMGTTQAQKRDKVAPGHVLYGEGADLPMHYLAWLDAIEFCTRLSRKVGRVIELPTEAEWEHACRAGTATAFHTGDTITSDQAYYDTAYRGGEPRSDLCRDKTIAVGSFEANAFGLYDMHGNVGEWCSDWYGTVAYAARQMVTDPRGPQTGTKRICRGGSWYLFVHHNRSANRSSAAPGQYRIGVGIRVAIHSSAP